MNKKSKWKYLFPESRCWWKYGSKSFRWMDLWGQPQIRKESMADGIPAVIKGACVFAHDRVDVFVRQFGWYRRSNRLLSHDAFAS